MGRPSGTVTFLFTDIEGSTQLWEDHPEAMREALERHDTVVSGAIDAHGGYVFSTGGDGFAAAFQRAGDAAAAALEGQLGLAAEAWPDGVTIRVRMGLHTGEASERNDDYFGPALNRAARLMAAAHGGQVLSSSVTGSLISPHLPGGAGLKDLGEHRLRDLSEPDHLFQLVDPRLQGDFPPLRSLDSYPGNLPVQATGFIGRKKELVAVTKALGAARVVTLCGVGGVGKTRLALQAAAETVLVYPDGVWLAELAAVSDPDGVDESIASALGVQPRPGTPALKCVLDYIRGKQLLIVLDNCEHILGAVARFVDVGVRESRGLQVLATSREGLAVPGESVITVPSLQLPGTEASPEESLESESSLLFVDRARESNSDFVVGPEDAADIADVCRRLDGIPLAIELAAARSNSMTPAEITAHLDQRFKLLTRGRRTASTRQQTLRNTIDWSYELLENPERQVFRRLAVFAGEFGLEAAESVVPGDGVESFDALDLLGRLVEKSLVVAESVSGSTRFRLLETIRDYAWERLEEAAELDGAGERHARYFLAFAERADAGLESPDETVWRRRVERELENLRAGLRWFISTGDADSALAEVYALSNVGSLSHLPFGMLALEVADMPAAADNPLRAAAFGCVAMTFAEQGELQESITYADKADALLASLGHPGIDKIRCRVRGCVTTPVAYQGDAERLLTLCVKGLDDARRSNDKFEELQSLVLL